MTFNIFLSSNKFNIAFFLLPTNKKLKNNLNKMVISFKIINLTTFNLYTKQCILKLFFVSKQCINLLNSYHRIYSPTTVA